MDKSKVEQMLEKTAENIFTVENLPTIVYKLNSLLPKVYPRIQDTEFKTIVEAAKLDGMQQLIQTLIETTNK